MYERDIYEKTPLVLFHKGCVDGFCSAWVARRGFLEADGFPSHWYDEAEYVAVNYQEPPPPVEQYKGRAVYILDFSYKRDVLHEICRHAGFVVLLDHHKSARQDLENFPSEIELAEPTCGRKTTRPHVVFDTNKSGAVLTWEHFFPDRVKHVPWLVRYSEDRDTWRFQLPLSREVNAAIYSYPFDFEVWDELNRFASHITLAKEGEHILRFQQKLVDQGVRHARKVVLAGHKVLAFNTPYFQSEIAGTLAEAEGQPFGVCWSMQEDGRFRVDLRSRGEDGLDVSEVAKQFGGGGHKHAAGFTADKLPFEETA